MAALNYAFENTDSEKYVDIWDYKKEKKTEKIEKDFLEKYEEDFENVKNKVNGLSKIVLSQSTNQEIKRKRDTVEYHTTLKKAEYVLVEMEDVEDIREQIQCVTGLLRQLDTLRQLLSDDLERRKLTAFFYSVLKKNCDDEIFQKEQLEIFQEILQVLAFDKRKEKDLYHVVQWERRMREAGLRTMISWE